jgi:glycosyltransferase involved in cell wall biosynthesis
VGRSSGPIRVLWLAKGLGPGGMERLLVNHARAGDRNRFDYRAAYLVERPESVVAELEALGVPCRQLGAEGSGWKWLPALWAMVRREAVDVVHAHSPMPAALARPLVRAMPGVRVVYTEHNTWDCYGRVTRAANAATYVLDNSTFAVSADARDSVPRWLRGRVEVLTHGIDLAAVRTHLGDRSEARRALGFGDGEVVVATVAHLRREKGYEVLLAAAEEVLRRHPEARFLSIGHGPLADELAGRHQSLGLGDRFRFLGFRPDVLSLLAASDVFCLSSHQEGLPVAFMEASALGRPAVVTAVGGLVDHVIDGRSGLLVPPGDPAALADALSRVVGDAGLREQLAHGALAGSDGFDAIRAVERQEAVYSELCGRPVHATPGGAC